MNFVIVGSFREEDFGSAIISLFPELREDIQEWTGLVTLQMMELRLFAEKQAAAGNTLILNTCVQLLQRALTEGDAQLKNAVYVSFLEHVNRSEEVGKRIYDALTPELREGWKEVNGYLDTLLNRIPPSHD